MDPSIPCVKNTTAPEPTEEMTGRVWCGLCGKYIYMGDVLPCSKELGKVPNYCPCLAKDAVIENVPMSAKENDPQRNNIDWDKLFAQGDPGDETDAKNVPAPGPKDTNPKTRYGITKPSLSSVPASALFHLGEAMTDGMRKYGLTNWRNDCVTASTYFNAAMRHMWAWWDGEEIAQDSKVHHLAHVMGCCAILLDAMEQGTLITDKPTPGQLPRFLVEHKKEIA